MTKIAIIDDDPLAIGEMKFLIEQQDGLSCSLAERSLGGFFESLKKDDLPDIVLLDINLNNRNSLEQIFKIKGLLPYVKIIITTGYPEYLMAAIKQGADGYYLKGSATGKLVDAIRITASGGTYIEPHLMTHLLEVFREEHLLAAGPANVKKRLEEMNFDLHRREIEVILGLVNNFSYKEIAQQNNISLNTVRHYVRTTYKKMKVSSRQELIKKLKGGRQPGLEVTPQPPEKKDEM